MSTIGTIKVSQLPLAASLASTDVGPFDHEGATCAVTAAQIYGANRREGMVNSVAADGSASAAVTFASVFPNSLTKLDAPAFLNYSGSDFPVFTYQITSVSTSGFTILVSGGQSGTTIQLNYGATGT